MILENFLTPKQQLFCDEYLKDRNATRAALTAGYSASTALNGQLMQLPKIKLYLQDKLAEVSARLSLSHDTLLRELSKVALANMGNYFNDDGKIKPLNEIGHDEMAAVQSITVSPDGTVKLRLCNKMAALEKIAKHLNFYNPPVAEQTPVYMFLDDSDISMDDSFDDDLLQDQVLYERKKKKKAEDRRLKLEALEQESKLRQQTAEEVLITNNVEMKDAAARETVTGIYARVENHADARNVHLSPDAPNDNMDGFPLQSRGGNKVDQNQWLSHV